VNLQSTILANKLTKCLRGCAVSFCKDVRAVSAGPIFFTKRDFRQTVAVFVLVSSAAGTAVCWDIDLSRRTQSAYNERSIHKEETLVEKTNQEEIVRRAPSSLDRPTPVSPLYISPEETQVNKQKEAKVNAMPLPLKTVMQSPLLPSIPPMKVWAKVTDGQKEGDREVVIMNTPKGIFPRKIELRKGQTYTLHLVNVDESHPNASLVSDSFSVLESTYFGKVKTISITPEQEGIYSIMCPETSNESQFVVVDPSPERMPASLSQ